MACDYCGERMKSLIEEPPEHGVAMFVFIDLYGNLIAASETAYGNVHGFGKAKINFCPMCGRDLREVE